MFPPFRIYINVLAQLVLYAVLGGVAGASYFSTLLLTSRQFYRWVGVLFCGHFLKQGTINGQTALYFTYLSDQMPYGTVAAFQSP